MNTKEYIKQAMVTSTAKYTEVADRLRDPKMINLLHATIGINTESGELTDVIKKYAFYGKEIDEVNLKEEIGDLFWYIAVACNALDISFEDCMKTNIEKLRARYGNSFSEERALKRDLKTERKILEE